MLDILMYLIIIAGISFMIYETHLLFRQAKLERNRGSKKVMYTIYIVAAIVWFLYLSVITYALITK